ncbi:MAG: DUF4912 domain-containing protein [Thermodesulfobacteriota bacterium]|nr:DUF4912 domain-containing protein [Thermodesulfobacteriota bacterium]
MTQEVEKPGPSKTKGGTRKGGKKSAGETVEALCVLQDAPMALNDLYGETRVVAVAVDPYLIHVYWEVTSEELKKARDSLDKDYGQSRAILRFYDVTSRASRSGNAKHAFDVNIDLQSRSRYVQPWGPGRAYLVELGFRSEEGSFYPIVRSNVAEAPRAAPAPQREAAGMLVQEHSERGVSSIDAPGGLRSDSRVQPGKAGPWGGLPKEGSSRVRPFQGIDLTGPQIPFDQGIEGSSEEGAGTDLADLSEKGFTLGVSSAGGASSRKEKGSADR